MTVSLRMNADECVGIGLVHASTTDGNDGRSSHGF